LRNGKRHGTVPEFRGGGGKQLHEKKGGKPSSSPGFRGKKEKMGARPLRPLKKGRRGETIPGNPNRPILKNRNKDPKKFLNY